MPDDVTVRPATEADVEAVQSVAEAAWHAAYADLLDEAVMDDLLEFGYAPSALRDLIESDTLELFVAAGEDGVRGYASCEPPEAGSVGRISIYVQPDHWGKGIGTSLFERGRKYLHDQGATRMEDRVLAANEAGNAFYSKHCEQVRETTVEMGGDRYDANVYSTPL